MKKQFHDRYQWILDFLTFNNYICRSTKIKNDKEIFYFLYVDFCVHITWRVKKTCCQRWEKWKKKQNRNVILFYFQIRKFEPEIHYFRSSLFYESVVMGGWEDAKCDSVQCSDENGRNISRMWRLKFRFTSFPYHHLQAIKYWKKIQLHVRKNIWL